MGRDIKNKSYPARLILNAVSAYNLGRTLEQTRHEMARRFHTKVPESTIHSWIREYSGVCRFVRLRGQAIKLYKPEEMVFTRSLNHTGKSTISSCTGQSSSFSPESCRPRSSCS